MSEHYASRKYVYDVIDPKLEREAASKYFDGTDQSRSYETAVVWEKILRFRHGSLYIKTRTPVKTEVPRLPNINLLGSALVYCLGCKVKGPLIPLTLVGSFFDYVPARLGRNAALDNAISCLCTIYGGAPSTQYNLSTEVYRAYAGALSSLRSCLSDPTLQMEPETLCASTLLQICEVNLVHAS